MSLDKAKGLLEEADKDGDMQLTYEEFVPFWLKRMEMESLKKLMDKLRLEFKKNDRDKSGMVSEHELKLVLQACGYEVDPEEVPSLLQQADTSGDGQLGYEEFVKFWIHKLELDVLLKIAEQMRNDFKVSALTCCPRVCFRGKTRVRAVMQTECRKREGFRWS